MQPNRVLEELRRYLTLAHVPYTEKATLKAFRRSKANAMAAAGHELTTILNGAEWRSKAVLHYLKNESVDYIAFLQQSLDLSDAEDEAAPEESPAKKGRPTGANDA